MSGSVLGLGTLAVNEMDKETTLSKVALPPSHSIHHLLCLPSIINIGNSYVFVDKSPFLLPGLRT